MNLVEVDVLLTAPPPDPPKLSRDEKDVKALGWPILNKLLKPVMPKCRESNGLENAELSAVCGCELRFCRPCPPLLNPAIKDKIKCGNNNNKS
jgi:hypothetical protein